MWKRYEWESSYAIPAATRICKNWRAFFGKIWLPRRWKNPEKLQGGLLQIFTEHEAVYHKICVSEYKAQKLQRAMKRN